MKAVGRRRGWSGDLETEETKNSGKVKAREDTGKTAKEGVESLLDDDEDLSKEVTEGVQEAAEGDAGGRSVRTCTYCENVYERLTQAHRGR